MYACSMQPQRWGTHRDDADDWNLVGKNKQNKLLSRDVNQKITETLPQFYEYDPMSTLADTEG